MPTCPTCGETKYDCGYNDGSVRVCYHCKNWGPPKNKEVYDELQRLKDAIKRRIYSK